MRSPRTPNQALRGLLVEAGWTGARLAREVNALGAAQGTVLHYDRTTVAHWLAGSRPRPPAPALVAEALSRGLGRTVRLPDTGLPDPDPAAPPHEPSEGSGVDHLEHVLRGTDPDGGQGHRPDRRHPGRHGTDRRSLALAGAFSLAALTVAPWQAAAEALPDTGTPGGAARVEMARGEPVRVEMAHVESAHELLAVLARSDAAFGAGAVREPLLRYLRATLLPWLRGSMRPAVRRELFTVAAQLTYLCAFAHFDTGRQAEAQRLYLTSARLAREAGDRVGYALALRGLSVQAQALRHFGAAHRLAEEAVRVGVRHTPAHQRAFLLGQLAVTEAGVGGPDSLRHLAAAERCLERSSSGGHSPVGAFHPGALARQHASVARSRGDHRGAVRALEDSLRHRPADERRSRAVCLAELAETHLEIGHLDQACAVWQTFLDLHPVVSSARTDDRLRTLLARLRPYDRNRAAAALLARAQESRRTARQ